METFDCMKRRSSSTNVTGLHEASSHLDTFHTVHPLGTVILSFFSAVRARLAAQNLDASGSLSVRSYGGSMALSESVVAPEAGERCANLDGGDQPKEQHHDNCRRRRHCHSTVFASAERNGKQGTEFIVSTPCRVHVKPRFSYVHAL